MSTNENIASSDHKKKRRKKFKWSGLTYASRLTISFAAIAAMTAMVSIGVLSFVWDQHFRTYTESNMGDVAKRTAEMVAKEYESAGDWEHVSREQIRTISGYWNIPIQVVGKTQEEDGEIVEEEIFDSTKFEFGNMSSIPQLELPKNAQTKIEMIEVNPRTPEAEVVGYVKVWMYGSDTLLSKADETFRANSYQAMFFASALAILLAMCLGFLFARNLVNPINRMIKTAQSIKEGDLSSRTDLKGDDEIGRLGATFDEMADSIEIDRELERRLTTDVAHELRTPLMAIQSTVEAMVDGVFEADAERLETVNSEVQRLSRLVDALLRLSRLENRSTPMEEGVVDVATLIAGLIATHEAFVSDSGLSLEFHADKDVYVYGDADMIRQATANLISNAVRYTPEGGNISVRVKKGDIMASIAVQDTGIGLTSEEAKMVFSRFWRADAGRNREYGGLGVGLSVVKEIVDRHGGWVHVEGKPEQGATFTIYIPLYDEENVKARIRGREKKIKRS